MKVAIIGAGFTGLSAALRLCREGHKVIIFEQDSVPGGLASGFKEKGWRWPLEKHYHHIFESDFAIRNLAREEGHRMIFRQTTTSMFTGKGISDFDTPSSLLAFPELNLSEKLRTGAVLLFLKITPFWKPLEKVTAEEFLNKWMGTRVWNILWRPLFEGKFGKYYRKIPASWFWARIKKRSRKLGYPEGGFENLANSLVIKITKLGGECLFDTSINQIEKKGHQFRLKTDKGVEYDFDKVISILPTPIFLKITRGLPPGYVKKLSGLKEIGAVNLVLILKQRFLTDIYWLNINSEDFPFLAVVEHTNYMSRRNYGSDRIIYVGNYLDSTHRYFGKSANQLLEEYLPFLKRINPSFDKSWVKRLRVFKTPFAQPIIGLNFSKKIPSMTTPINGLYLANIQQVYPWDRGTNYAVELGDKVADLVG